MPVSYLNLSRRLVRWMKQIQLPRSAIRMRYVRLLHAYHVMGGSCDHDAVITGMQTLLAGYVSVDEGDHITFNVSRTTHVCHTPVYRCIVCIHSVYTVKTRILGREPEAYWKFSFFLVSEPLFTPWKRTFSNRIRLGISTRLKRDSSSTR